MKNQLKLSIIASVYILSGCSGLKKHEVADHGGDWNARTEKIQYARAKKPAVEYITYPGKKPVKTEVLSSSGTSRQVLPELNKQQVPAAPASGSVGAEPALSVPLQEDGIISVSKKAEEHSSRKSSETGIRESSSGFKNGTFNLLTAISLIGLSAFGLLLLNRKKATRLTRFAKRNPRKTQVLITALQLFGSALGILGGYNLHKMGYHTDLMHGLIAAFLGLTGFFMMPFLKRDSGTIMPAVLLRRRAVMLGMIMCNLTSSAILGNNLHNIESFSGAHALVEKADQRITGSVADAFYGDVQNPDNEMKARSTVEAGAVILAILITIILLTTTCVGVCLVMGLWDLIGFAYVFGGLIIVGLSIWGIIAIWMWALDQ